LLEQGRGKKEKEEVRGKRYFIGDLRDFTDEVLGKK
jgi:hypothetical protein